MNKVKPLEWVSIGILLLGIILMWLHIDEKAILLNVGFVSFGVVVLIAGISGGYYKQLTVDTLQLVLPIITILLAVDNLIGDNHGYALIGLTILFQYIIGQGRSFAWNE